MSSMKPSLPSPPSPTSSRRTCYDKRNSKKRLFSDTMNSRFLMDPEVIDIPPPVPSSFNKKKQVAIHEVIDVGNDEDSSDVMILHEMVDVRNKGKAVIVTSDVYSPIQAQDFMVKHLGSINKVEPSKHSMEGSYNVYNLEGDLAYDDDFLDNYYLSDFWEVDEYAMMQAHFDNFDIPAGVEASVPWFSEFSESKNNISHANTQSSVNGNDQSHSTWLSESAHVKVQPSHGNNLEGDLVYDDDFLDNYYLSDFWEVDEYAMMQAHFDNFDIPAGVEASVPWFSEFSESKNNISHANTQSSVNGNDQSHSTWLSESAHVKKKPASVSSSSFLTPVDPISHSPGGAGVTSQHKLTSQILRGRNIFQSYQVGGSVSSSIGNHLYSTIPPGPINPTYWNHHRYAAKTHDRAVGFMPTEATHTMVSEPSMSLWPPPMKPKYNLKKHNVYSSFADPVDGAYITPQEVTDIRNRSNVNEADILSKFRLFKQFNTVEDFSDHHYASSGSSTKQPPKNWAKKIQEEWRMLEKDLPDTIFVRVYESRMDLLRAVIIGAEGTPYHDGLFFFDVFFPASYPKAPPHVYYHSGGLGLNPNLYSSGKVCLSLLNTWFGNKNENWIPGMSTMFQVLVSIQALILNQDPYFNEPGRACHRGTQRGDLLSRKYNENTFILSLKTMIYSMRRPPKHFEDFAVGHFYMRAQNILVACKAYMDGAQVGCLTKGDIQDVNEGDKSCSKKFKDSVAGCVNMLVKEFTVLGVKDCEKFLVVTQSRNNQH